MQTELQTEQTPQSNPPQLQVLPAPKSKPRARNGKIARLPYPERDMVNRMLRNNIA